MAACDLWNDSVTKGCKIDSAANRLDYIIAGEILRDLIPRLHSVPKPNRSFSLRHADLSVVNNIYVDDITSPAVLTGGSFPRCRRSWL